jgi:hypothetical protein
MKKIVILTLGLIGLSMMSFTNAKLPTFVEQSASIRIGTYLWQNCQGSNPCGPCAGICFRRGGKKPKKIEDFVIGNPVEEGTGVFNIVGLSNNTITLEFKTIGFTNGNLTGIEEDMELGNELSSAYGYSDIIIKEGIYNVDFTNSTFGKAIFNVTLVP